MEGITECVWGYVTALQSAIMNEELRTAQSIGSMESTCAAVLFRSRNTGKMKVVALATGTNSNRPTRDKSLLYNFHAEVVVRRAFIAFLQEQLLLLCDSNYLVDNRKLSQSEYFEKACNCGSFSLQLNENIEVIFYISKPPCGDGEDFKARRNLGKLRVKYADGEGTHPLDSASVDRISNISCSDRILSWNVVGIQGSHLAGFLHKPIFIDVLAVSNGDEGTIMRAVTGRYKGNLSIKQPLFIGLPQLQKEQPAKYSINSYESNRFEKVNTTSGKKQEYILGYPPKEDESRLSRQQTQQRSNYLEVTDIPKKSSTCREYEEKKQALRVELKRQGYGDWSSLKLMQHHYVNSRTRAKLT